MKIAIVYKSVTGNTQKIAEVIKNEIKLNDIVYFGEPQENINADIYFIGSWTYKGMCCKEIGNFLKTLENKKIAYFGTAGFGGDTKYYNTIFSRIENNISKTNIILGYFFCQGKMPINVRERYVSLIKENPNDKNLEVSIENFDKAILHPDEKDIDNVKDWVNKMLTK